jgi:drug/metabolite transporter (DMT)-like permease
MTINHKTFFGAVLISFAAILWGLDGVVLTPRLYGLDIAFVVMVFHVLPFVLMNLFLYSEYKYLRIFTLRDYVDFTLVALLGGALGTMAIVRALFLVGFQELSVVVLLQKLQPVFAIALAALFLKEKLRPRFALWAGLAIIGGYFLTFGWQLPNLHTGENTGKAAFYALIAAIAFGGSTVFSKKVLRKYRFHTATFYRYGFTSIIMLVYVLVSAKLNFQEVTFTHWILFVVIALTTGSGAIFLYYYGLNRVRAMVATICELFFPISAVMFDYIFNGSRLSWVQWGSAAVMVFAIIQLNRDKARK